MKSAVQEIRDPQTNRLLGIYYQEEGVFEIRQKHRAALIKLPPNTTPQFEFSDS